ncbi:hypothetical protein, partial [Roseisolibacter sp. H3M3-2]|uniref:hypothetical protein n=1 Tax=Roseisolibacter sp. H3M3-2 TaxID=3031323 RepID=UPI0023DAF5D3
QPRRADARGAGAAGEARDTLRLESLPWPVDSAQAVRRAALARQGASSLQLPMRVTGYAPGASRVRVGLAADVEPRVVLLCASGEATLHPNGVTVVERRYTAARGPGR